MANVLNRQIKEGEIVILAKRYIDPKYWADRRVSVNGGFGMEAFTSGSALSCKWLSDGEESRWEGYMIDPEETRIFQEEGRFGADITPDPVRCPKCDKVFLGDDGYCPECSYRRGGAETDNDIIPIICPECESDQVATIENVIGYAYVSGIMANGMIEYQGETEIDWNSQRTIKNKNGEIHLHCMDCSEEWFMDLEEYARQRDNESEEA